MRRDRRGMAAMFDALMFLAVASIVSVALLGAFSGAAGPQDQAVQEKVEAAHLVLLRSTLAGGSGDNITVLEMTAAEVADRAQGSSLDMAAEALPLLLPGMGFEWRVECGERTLVTSSSGPPAGSDIYCSQVDMGMPWGQVVFRLRAWVL